MDIGVQHQTYSTNQMQVPEPRRQQSRNVAPILQSDKAVTALDKSETTSKAEENKMTPVSKRDAKELEPIADKRDIQFTPKIPQPIFKSVDKDTGDILMQIPSEDALRLREMISKGKEISEKNIQAGKASSASTNGQEIQKFIINQLA